MTHPPHEIGLPIGTPVLTPGGEVPVEALSPGALVIAVSGVAAPFRPLEALRRTTVPGALVRIRAGALAEGCPRHDLLLPPGHALLLDGRLVAAGALLGGPGARLEQTVGLQDTIALVLGSHDAVLAAGVAVETALPDAAAPPCAPRGGMDAPLRALLGWRAEAMGWLPPVPEPEELPCASLRDELLTFAFPRALPAPPG